MSVLQNTLFNWRFDWSALDSGVRFLLFPQPPVVTGETQPEVVRVSLPPGSVRPGPSDDRMYVRDAVDKQAFYEYPYLPPYEGKRHPEVMPSADGHFDHLEPGTHEFEAAHLYGTVRRVLDIWETYFGQRLDWHFAEDYERLELVPWLEWDNAHSGYGFIEMGYQQTADVGRMPMSLNFDVIAHELGHTMLYSVVGTAPEEARTPFLAGFHESSSDLVAIVAALHFDSIVDLLLERTRGNLYVRNLLNRFGEISATEQIRLAGNRLRMSDVPDVTAPVESLSHVELHQVGEPLTGAIFDILVEVFQQLLVDRGLISRSLDALSRRDELGPTAHDEVQPLFDAAYALDPSGFKGALVDARDYLGALLARTWSRLDVDLTFVEVGQELLRGDLELTGGHFQPEILDSLVWREIGGRS